jgi:hypothetical protein
VPEVDFRECPFADACTILSEQTGIIITDARTNRVGSTRVTVTSEMRHQTLLFVLEWMALDQHCALRVTTKAAIFVDAHMSEPNPASHGTALPRRP